MAAGRPGEGPEGGGGGGGGEGDGGGGGLALPALAVLAAGPLYLAADTAVVGRAGTAQLAGLGVAAPLLATLWLVAAALSIGVPAIAQRFLGTEGEGGSGAAARALALAAAVGAGLALAGLALSAPAVDAVGAAGAVREQALAFLRTGLAGVPAVVVAVAGTGLVRGAVRLRSALALAGAAAAAGLAVDVALAAGPGVGVAGVALTTAGAQWAVAAATVARVARAARRGALAPRPGPAALGRLRALAGPAIARAGAVQVAVLGAAVVATRMGDTDVAAHQVGVAVWSLLALALAGAVLATARRPRSRAVPAAARRPPAGPEGATGGGGDGGAPGGDEERVRAGARRLAGWGLAAGCALGAAALVAHPVVPWAFTDDLLVVELASFVTVFAALAQPLAGAGLGLDLALGRAGDLAFDAGVTVVAVAAFLPLAGLVLAFGGGLGWLWAAVVALVGVRAAALAARVASPAWPAARSGSPG